MAKKVTAPLAKSEESVRTPKGVLIYPHLFTPDEVSENFNAIIAYDPALPEASAFEKVVKKFATEAFGGEFPEKMTWCIRSGDTWADKRKTPVVGAVREAVRGKRVLLMKSVHAPTVSLPEGGKLVVAETKAQQGQVYMGCVVAAQGKLAAFNGQYPAVVFWMTQVAKLGRGEKIGGVDPNKAFGDLVDADEDLGSGPAPADLDDEIPF